MENEQMNQQPTYDQVVNAYNALVSENQQLRFELNNLRNDKTLERMSALVDVVNKLENSKDAKTRKIVNNAKWHLNEILAKPKRAN